MLLGQQRPATSHLLINGLRRVSPRTSRKFGHGVLERESLYGAASTIGARQSISDVSRRASGTPIKCLGGNRQYSTQNDKPREIAVIGGGVTGLATAYFLTEALPKIKVTIFESKDILGGWIKSTPMKVEGDGEIMFESGPRSLRPGPPNGTLALRMVGVHSKSSKRSAPD
jgi:hypothetical protein